VRPALLSAPRADTYRAILRRVGLVLIAVGLADIGYMIYCIVHSQSYSSSLNIFAVIGGVFLLRANLFAVRIVTWLAAFMLTVFAAAIILIPFLKPIDLWRAELRQQPALPFAFGGVVAVVLIAVIAWVYWQLRSDAVLAARAAAGGTVAPPRMAFILGVSLVLVSATAVYFAVTGDAAHKALRLAKERYGEEYKYHVTSMNWSNHHVRAGIAAYNEREIRPVEIEWQE
jgi:hypothetical protein